MLCVSLQARWGGVGGQTLCESLHARWGEIRKQTLSLHAKCVGWGGGGGSGVTHLVTSPPCHVR